MSNGFVSEGDDTSVAPSAPPAIEEALQPEIRERLMRQFGRWLDQMLAGEPPPPGLPEELLAEGFLAEAGAPGPASAGAAQRDCDLYTLFASLTTLTGEIRLQGRAFKQLIDALAPLSEVPEQLHRLEQLGDRQAAGDDDLPVSGKAVCEVMLDLYDRLERGLRTCDSGIAALRLRRGGWLWRWGGAARSAKEATASAEAIRDAAALTLGRLQSVLNDWGIERIGRIGEPFDPLRMSVVQVRPSTQFESGTVLEVNRGGYALSGRVKATAQVTVARADQ